MKYFELFIDELGNHNPIDKKSGLYILSGCAVSKEGKIDLTVKADQIKFKYWGHTNIVFHSRDIGRRKGPFNILKNKKLYTEFINDIFVYLKEAKITSFIIVCDKKIIRRLGWNSTKVIIETARQLLINYTVWLLGKTNSKGKIIIESATAEKDRYYLNEFSNILSPNNSNLLGIEHKKIKMILTSIAFVTKQNYDIEEQIADIFAYAASCKYLRSIKVKSFKTGSYEDKIIRILDNKLFRMPTKAGDKKMKFYKEIESFCLVPRK